jgi:transposase
MQKRDGRSVPDAALEVLRERAVAMREAGNSQLAIASALGVHKNTVHRWLKGWRVAGTAALKAKRRGRRPQAQRLLNAAQATEVQQLMTEHCPDQLELPFALWGREAVRDLARARFGVTLALRTVSDYLRRWGFTPQRPIRRASERQDAAVQAWLTEHYPKIAARAKAERAEIHWGDETGISNQAAYGRSFAPKGQTPVIRRTARRYTTSMISTVTIERQQTLDPDPEGNAASRRRRPRHAAVHDLRRRSERGSVPHLSAAPGAQCQEQGVPDRGQSQSAQGREGPDLGGRAPRAARAVLPAGLRAGAQSGRVPAQ